MALRSSQSGVLDADQCGGVVVGWFCGSKLLVAVEVGPVKNFCHLLEPETYCCKLLCGAVVVWVVL